MIDPPTGQNVRRQKSWDMLDQNAITYARQHKVQPHQVRDFPKIFHVIYTSYKCVLHVILVFFLLKSGAFILLIINSKKLAVCFMFPCSYLIILFLNAIEFSSIIKRL